jgi:hypothetical protein
VTLARVGVASTEASEGGDSHANVRRRPATNSKPLSARPVWTPGAAGEPTVSAITRRLCYPGNDQVMVAKQYLANPHLWWGWLFWLRSHRGQAVMDQELHTNSSPLATKYWLFSLLLMWSLWMARPCFAIPAAFWQPVPLDRLLTNVSSYVARNPDDAWGRRWCQWREPAGRWKRAWRAPRQKWGWTSMKCATGTLGVVCSFNPRAICCHLAWRA